MTDDRRYTADEVNDALNWAAELLDEVLEDYGPDGESVATNFVINATAARLEGAEGLSDVLDDYYGGACLDEIGFY